MRWLSDAYKNITILEGNKSEKITLENILNSAMELAFNLKYDKKNYAFYISTPKYEVEIKINKRLYDNKFQYVVEINSLKNDHRQEQKALIDFRYALGKVFYDYKKSIKEAKNKIKEAYGIRVLKLF